MKILTLMLVLQIQTLSSPLIRPPFLIKKKIAEKWNSRFLPKNYKKRKSKMKSDRKSSSSPLKNRNGEISASNGNKLRNNPIDSIPLSVKQANKSTLSSLKMDKSEMSIINSSKISLFAEDTLIIQQESINAFNRKSKRCIKPTKKPFQS